MPPSGASEYGWLIAARTGGRRSPREMERGTGQIPSEPLANDVLVQALDEISCHAQDRTPDKPVLRVGDPCGQVVLNVLHVLDWCDGVWLCRVLPSTVGTC